jgi:hypothetical protein
LVAPVFITWTTYEYQREKVRKSVKRMMMAGIKSEELILLRFAQAEKNRLLNWKHSKEFEYKGEMYDIVESTESGDSVFYWCWWDYEETRLNRQLAGQVSAAMGHDRAAKSRQDQLNKFLHSLFFSDLFDWIPYPVERRITGMVYFSHLYEIYLPPPAPPPKEPGIITAS